MSELNLAQSGQYDPNAKHPTSVETATVGAGNIKVGKISGGADPVLGFTSPAGSLQTFGEVSENLKVLDSEDLGSILVGADDILIVDYGGQQPLTALSLDVTIDGVTVACPWDAPSTSFKSAEEVGLFDQLAALVGATTDLSITETE